MRGGHKEVRAVLKFARENGFEVVRSKSHIVLKREGHIVSMSMSPSCPYGPSNAVRDIRKVIDQCEKKPSSGLEAQQKNYQGSMSVQKFAR
jgi:hypothetical protein